MAHIQGLIYKFQDTVNKNGKQPASIFKHLSMILYISLNNSPQYQKNSIDISFEFSVLINQGLYVRRSPDFFNFKKNV